MLDTHILGWFLFMQS